MSQQPVAASIVSTRPALPVGRLTIGGRQMDTVVFIEVSVTKRAGSHDMAQLTMLWPTVSAPEIERSTISFSYGEGNRSETFKGYVYSVQKSQGFKSQVLVTITCLGPTWAMRSVTPRILSGTASSVLSTLVAPHALGHRSPADAYVYPRIAQVTQSDWEMVGQLAHLSGNHPVSTDGVVRLVDAVAELDKKAPARQYTKSTNLLEPGDMGLLDFSPTASVTTHKHHLQPTFSYFGTDNQIRTYVPKDADPVDVGAFPGMYVPDSVSADHFVSVQNRWNSQSHTGEARVRGDGAVGPGDTIAVSTGISGTVVDDYDGMWFVVGVEHKIDSKMFQTNLKLSRDRYRPVDQRRPVRRYWSEDSRQVPSLTLSGSGWVSNWRS